MDEGTAKRFLGYLGSTSFSRSGAFLNGMCPYAPWRHQSGTDSHPSFGIKLDTSEPFGFCFSCGSSASLPAMLMELVHLSAQNENIQYDIPAARKLLEAYDDELVIQEWTESTFGFPQLRVIPEWWLNSFIPAANHVRSTQYLATRGVTSQISNLLGLRYDTQRDVIGFPARDFDNRLVGMRGRKVELPGDAENDFPRFHEYKYQNFSNSGEVWLGEHLVDLARPLVVVEGNFDWARVFGVYSNVVAAQTATVSQQKIKTLMGAWSLVLCLDDDVAGRRGADQIRRVLGKDCVIEQVIYPQGFKDAGSMTDDQIREMLSPWVGIL